MTNMLCESAFFGVVISLLAYELGMLLKKKFGLPIFNPLLISIAVVIVFLAVFDIDYQNYNDGAKYLSYLLTPATVCLAIPLYEQMEALKKNIKAILAGILSGVLTSLTVVLALALIFNLNHKNVCNTAAEIHHNGHRHGCFGRARRCGDDHGCRYHHHGCAGKYAGGDALQAVSH